MCMPLKTPPKPSPATQWSLPPNPHQKQIAEDVQLRRREALGEGFRVDLCGAEAMLVAPPVAPHDEDWVVSNGNELATLMNDHQITNLFMVGFEAGSCLLNISSAVIDMARRGYRCFIVEEGSLGLETRATRGNEEMKYAFHRVAQMAGYCYLVNAQDILDGLAPQDRGSDQ
jgi:nicotinamidase-related amidase